MSTNPAEAIASLMARDATVATAESLTGGMLCAALTSVPGASASVRGGIIAYDVAVKSALLGVDAVLLERMGAVDPEVARQMARGVRDAIGSTYGIATTGSAGPDPAPGGTRAKAVAAGTGFVAVSGPGVELVRGFSVDGDRAQVRAAAVSAALGLLAEALADGHLPG